MDSTRGKELHAENALRMVAWEVTRRCNLACVHCRASAVREIPENEFSTRESLEFLDDLARWAQPVVILTGGEPLLRDDIFAIADHGTRLGLRMVIAPNGTLVTDDSAVRLRESGIKRVSISLDGSTPATHDRFRQVEGAFDGALRGIECLKRAGLDFQINTTITQDNLEEIPRILELALRLGAVAHHVFLLVPAGRGKEYADHSIDARQYEEVLHWLYDQRERVPIHLKATCAPHYYRILRQRAKSEGKRVTFETHGLDAVTRGCLGGRSFCFVSHVGDVQPCGYLETKAGNIRETPFHELWKNSELFRNLRNPELYSGKCGICEYRNVCGGCRARAYAATGDYLSEEPLCSYTPGSERRGGYDP